MDRSCVTPSAIQREDPQEVLTFTRSTKNKFHFSSPHQEPSTKQKGRFKCEHLPSLVVGVLIHCNSSLIQENFTRISPTKQEMATPLGTTLSTDEQVVAQGDVTYVGKTIESLIVEFD